MFNLVDVTGQKILMRSGDPFAYSTPELAAMGRKALASKFDGLRIVGA